MGRNYNQTWKDLETFQDSSKDPSKKSFFFRIQSKILRLLIEISSNLINQRKTCNALEKSKTRSSEPS